MTDEVAGIPEQSRNAFYEAGLLGLRALDQAESTPRRFGASAEARWKGFRGHVGTADRIDLLFRDAAVKWAAGFSPASVFNLPGLASDEPFGPDWSSLPEHRAKQLWVAADEGWDGPVGLALVARVLGIETVSGESGVSLPAIAPQTRLVVAGGAATYAVASHFQRHRELSWSDQVLVVAERPAFRQFAGLVAPIIQAKEATRMVLPRAGLGVTEVIEEKQFFSGGEPVVSPDAMALCRQVVSQVSQK